MTEQKKHFKIPTQEKLDEIQGKLKDCNKKLEKYGGLSILKYFLSEDNREELENIINLDNLSLKEDFSDYKVSQKLSASFKILKDSIIEVESKPSNSEDEFADILSKYLKDVKLKEAEKILKENVKKVLSLIKPIERAYQSAYVLFANAGKEGEEIEKLHFVNATIEQLQKNSAKKDNRNFAYTIKNALKVGFDDSDLGENYSLLQIGGYLGTGKNANESKSIIETWAEIADNHMVLLLTDYKECKTLQDIKDFQNLKIANPKTKKLRSVIMTGNYAIVRTKSLYEDEDFLGFPSSVLCGLFISDEMISQADAGATFGKTEKVLGVNNNSFYSEAQQIREKGLNVLYYSRSARQTHVEGNTTLYTNVKDLTNKQASVVRTKFFLEKFFRNYLNKITFAGINSKVETIAEDKILNALEDLKYEGLIKSFSKISAKQNPRKKSQLIVDFNVEFIFAAEEIKLKINSD